MTAGRDWRDEVIDAAKAAGLRASRDEPDSILMAEARSMFTPGGDMDRLAIALASDLLAKSHAPVTRAACATLVRAACNAKALLLLGYSEGDALDVIVAAGAKLEMQAAP